MPAETAGTGSAIRPSLNCPGMIPRASSAKRFPAGSICYCRKHCFTSAFQPADGFFDAFEKQSVNEELATVYSELLTKVTDLARANNDMNNLLAGTGIGTIFVNHQYGVSSAPLRRRIPLDTR
jgi:hypothetical protein